MVPMNTKRKQALFLIANTLIWCALGALFWFLIGNQLFNDDIYAICFVGYPGFFPGLIGGFIYLFKRGN